MLPVKETAPRRRFPFFTLLLIIVNVWVYVYQVTNYEHMAPFMARYAFTPAKAFSFPYGIMTWFTSMFLHAGILHLAANMYFLWLFGDNVESKLGHWRYLFFYILCGLCATATHLYFNQGLYVPSVGASGAISGILGAYFIFFPGATVFVSLLIFFKIPLPAFLFLGIWFAGQFFSGLDTIGGAAAASNIAFWAHVGGFVSGMVLVFFFKRR
jgi:membrane associated rhomboid family serine protease